MSKNSHLLLFLFLFLQCYNDTSLISDRAILSQYFKAENKDSLIIAAYSTGKLKDSTFIDELLEIAYDQRVSHHKKFYGMSVHQAAINALKKISGIVPRNKITYEVDRENIQFYRVLFDKTGKMGQVELLEDIEKDSTRIDFFKILEKKKDIWTYPTLPIQDKYLVTMGNTFRNFGLSVYFEVKNDSLVQKTIFVDFSDKKINSSMLNKEIDNPFGLDKKIHCSKVFTTTYQSISLKGFFEHQIQSLPNETHSIEGSEFRVIRKTYNKKTYRYCLDDVSSRPDLHPFIKEIISRSGAGKEAFRFFKLK